MKRPIQYGLTMDNQNFINQKAATKKDGCYAIRGVAYRVRNGRVTHFAADGEIITQHGHFNVVAGKVGSFDCAAALDAIKLIKESGND